MSDALVFLAWQRPGIYGLATDPGGPVARLEGALPLEMQERDGSGPPRTADACFEIMGPGDVGGLQRRAIRRMVPPPATLDTETTKCVHVELAAPDLPWRYTPALASGQVLHPWIVVVVGTLFDPGSGLGETQLLPDNQIRLHPDVLAAHPLAESSKWAHVQIELSGNHPDIETGADLATLIESEGGVPVARLVSPRPLLPGREYIAAVVPAFDADGNPAWAGPDGQVVLPVHHHWRFRSGEGGDFRTLAARLHIGTPDPINGRAPLVYDRIDPAAQLEVRGAIAPVDGSDQPISGTPAQTDADGLTSLPPDPRGRPIIAPPVYGAAWLADPKSRAWGGGPDGGLNNDPRHRGVAGLGAHVGIVEQETIVDAVRDHAGSVNVASQRISQLSMGLRASAGLWNQRLPSTAEHRLLVYGPAMRRLVTAEGTVLNRIAGGERPMPPALFSAAARRVLRRGTARGDLAQSGALDPVQVVRNANTCPPLPEVFLPGLPHIDLFANDNGLPSYGELLKIVNEPGHTIDPASIFAIIDEVKNNLPFQTPAVIEFLDALKACVDQYAQKLDLAWVIRMLMRCLDPAMHTDGDFLEEIARLDCEAHVVDDPPRPELPPELEPPERPCFPVIIETLDETLTDAIDPTGENPWISEIVIDTLDGIDDDLPPEIEPGVDMPTWRLLRDQHADWLLPGVGLLENDGVYAFESNPTFVDAFLLGLNTQMLGELRWRNLPIATGSTPLRMFWGRVEVDAFGNEQRLDDILSVGDWTDTALGDGGHRPPGASAANLILVIRSELFRRYPETLVSAVPAALDDGEPSFDPDDAPDETVARAWPVFQGQITDDVTFFGFDLTVDDGRRHWIVLEEPPAGYRFRSDVALPATDGAHFAHTRFNNPTRVMISGAQLLMG